MITCDLNILLIQKRTKVFLKIILLYYHFHLSLQFAFKIESASNMTIFQTSGLERHPSGKSTVLLTRGVLLGGDIRKKFRVFGLDLLG